MRDVTLVRNPENRAAPPAPCLLQSIQASRRSMIPPVLQRSPGFELRWMDHAAENAWPRDDDRRLRQAPPIEIETALPDAGIGLEAKRRTKRRACPRAAVLATQACAAERSAQRSWYRMGCVRGLVARGSMIRHASWGSTKIRGVKRRDRPPFERRAGVRGRRFDVQPSMSATWEAPKSVGSNGETVFRLKGERAFEVDVLTFNRRCRLL